MFEYLFSKELEELERIHQKKVNDRVELAMEYSRHIDGAEAGNLEEMYKCFELTAIMSVQDHNGQFYCDSDAFKYLEKSAKGGYTKAVKMFAILYLTGEVPGIGKCNIMPYPPKALEICSYFSKKDMEKESIKEFVQIIKEEAERTENSSTKSTEGCYIATAVYGDYDAHEVLILRKFRDNVLLNHLWGVIFVKIYYWISPSLAKKLRNMTFLNKRVKIILDKFVKRLEKGEYLK